jgi:hypothetical protein
MRPPDRRLLVLLESVMAVLTSDDTLLKACGLIVADLADGKPPITAAEAQVVCRQIIAAQHQVHDQLVRLAALSRELGPRRVM